MIFHPRKIKADRQQPGSFGQILSVKVCLRGRDEKVKLSPEVCAAQNKLKRRKSGRKGRLPLKRREIKGFPREYVFLHMWFCAPDWPKFNLREGLGHGADGGRGRGRERIQRGGCGRVICCWALSGVSHLAASLSQTHSRHHKRNPFTPLIIVTRRSDSQHRRQRQTRANGAAFHPQMLFRKVRAQTSATGEPAKRLRLQVSAQQVRSGGEASVTERSCTGGRRRARRDEALAAAGAAASSSALVSFRNKREQLESKVTLLQLKPGKPGNSGPDGAKRDIFYSVDRRRGQETPESRPNRSCQELAAKVKGQKMFPGKPHKSRREKPT